MPLAVKKEPCGMSQPCCGPSVGLSSFPLTIPDSLSPEHWNSPHTPLVGVVAMGAGCQAAKRGGDWGVLMSIGVRDRNHARSENKNEGGKQAGRKEERAKLEALASLISVVLRHMGCFLCLQALRTSRQDQCVRMSLGLPSMVMGLNAGQLMRVMGRTSIGIIGSTVV
ncbi:hypothetical protein QQF64_008347 [Cirrhinus molitorella]|uniref:Uncharacterized protein n=1 Tax=Cirrhinus molitorella TaxID=172907 RepID=A0ABR3M6P7_9TELE